MTKTRRSARGEVTLFKPSGGVTWWIRYRVDGHQKRQNTGKADKDEARQFAANVARMVGLATSDDLDAKRKLLRILEDLIEAIPELRDEAGKKMALGKAPTVREWFTQELTEAENPPPGSERQPVKKQTLDRYKEVFEDWFTYLDGLPVPMSNATLERITPEQVRGYLAQLKEQGLSGSSRKFSHARLRAVFGHAVNSRRIVSNPAAAREMNPKTGRMRFEADSNRRAFNLRQVASVMEAAAAQTGEPWLYLSALLALYTGQRCGDICAMRWEHVRDLDGALPRIALEQRKTGATLVVPIAEPLRQALQAVPEAERNGHLLPDVICRCYLDGKKRRFQRPWRDLLDGVKLSELEDLPIKARIERAGIRGRARNAWTFHSWRHTTATYLAGPDAHYLLGHRSEDEKRLGTTALYRDEDLMRLKTALDGIPAKLPANVIQLPAGKAAA